MSSARIIPGDTLVLFADLQAGVADLPMTVSADRLRRGVSALARLAKIFGLPAIVTAVPGPDGGAPAILPEIEQALGPYGVFLRTTADAFRNDTILARLKASGRKTVLISGVATELAVQLPAITGASLGLRTFVVLDACGGMSSRTDQAAIHRMQAAGAGLVSAMTLAGELPDNLGGPEGRQSIPIIFEMAAAG